MKKFLSWVLALTVLLGTSSTVRSQEKPAETMQPVLVVSVSGYDEIRNDLDWIGKLGGSPLAEMVDMGLKLQLGVQDFTGLDKSRPWGLVVQTDGQDFSGYSFLPVTDLKQLLKTLEGSIGEPKESGKDVLEIDIQGRPMYVKGVGGWAFISVAPEALADVPTDPVAALDGLNKTYDLGIRVTVKSIPPIFRQMLLAPLQMGMQMGMERREGETDEQYALRTKIAREAADQMNAAINDLDTLLVGLAIDPKKELGILEYQITAVPGTKLAKHMAQTKEQKTQFAGFLQPDAAVSLIAASELGESDVAQAKLAIESRKSEALAELEKQGLGGEELKLARRLIDELADVIQKTLEGKRWEGGAVVYLGADRLTAVAGSRIVDAAKLEKLVKDLVEQASKDQPELAAAIKLNAEEYQGYQFHRITVPTDELDQAANLSEFVGNTLTVILALGSDSVYLAAGRDADKTLKQVIDQSKAEAGKTIPPTKLVIAGTPVAQFAAAAIDDEDAQARVKKIVDLLQKSAGKDKAIVTSTPVPNGVQVRLEVQQGLLKILGALPTLGN